MVGLGVGSDWPQPGESVGVSPPQAASRAIITSATAQAIRSVLKDDSLIYIASL